MAPMSPATFEYPTTATLIPCPHCGLAPAELNGKQYIAAHRNDCSLRDTLPVAIKPTQTQP